jgi:hypothetical protein
MIPFVHLVIHQFAQAGFPEEPPENEQAVLIFANFRSLKRAHFFPDFHHSNKCPKYEIL